MDLIRKWQRKLGLMDWYIVTEAIDDAQVTYPDDLHGEDRSFVGVHIAPPKAIIYHSRELREDDIIHELLHIAHPKWSEDRVQERTEELCQ